MNLLQKILFSFALTTLSLTASAAMISDNSGFVTGDSLVTFDEVALSYGQTVTNEFESFGITFDPNLVASDDFGYGDTTGFADFHMANFFPEVNPFTVNFTSTVDAFGAYWEFDYGNVATFDAYLDGILVESFDFTEDDCCYSGTFLGFSDIDFNSVQVSVSGSTLMIMDNLQFSAAPVPEPTGLALLALGLVGLGFGKRKSS